VNIVVKMTIDKSIGERLKQFIDETGLSQNAVSKQIKVPQSFLSPVITGKKGISARTNGTLAF